MQRWELVLDVNGILWMCVVDRDDTETLCQVRVCMLCRQCVGREEGG